MKATGIVRRMDDLGRIVIPMEMRRTLEINVGDPIEFYVNNNGDIVLRKYEPGCVLCGSAEDMQMIRGKHLCKECRTFAARTLDR